MLAGEFVYRQNEFLIVGTLLASLLCATEIGFRRGRMMRTKNEDLLTSHYWTLQAGVMGLLALLLAFTFSMSVTRYEARKQLLIEEANAIGTAYLRSRVLKEPHRSEVARLMDKYVECRLSDYSTALDEAEAAAANRACVRLQKELWSEAAREVEQNPAVVPTGMLLTSLNDAFDVATKRDAARENHVPEPVLTFLFVVAILTLGLTGYGCGLGNHRHLGVTTTVCSLIALVTLVIMDLDRPRRGMITISQTPMVDLCSRLREH